MLSRIKRATRWRLGFSAAAPELEKGTDRSVSDFYSNRITACEFLDDPNHYEHPRAKWVLSVVCGGSLLEIGCGNGGMTRLLSPKVDRIVAFDVSLPSLVELEKLGLPNVQTEQGLVENYRPTVKFDWVVMSEVIEHLRKPKVTIDGAFELVAPGGSMVLTTPNGHWESDEHLHEFSMTSLSAILSGTGCESFECSYLRDRSNRRRWVTAVLRKAINVDEPNDFFDRAAIARNRREKR